MIIVWIRLLPLMTAHNNTTISIAFVIANILIGLVSMILTLVIVMGVFCHQDNKGSDSINNSIQNAKNNSNNDCTKVVIVVMSLIIRITMKTGDDDDEGFYYLQVVITTFFANSR